MALIVDLTSNLSGFRPSFSMLKTLSSPSSRKSGGSTVLVGASELNALVVAKAETLGVVCRVVRQGAEAAILGAANVLDDPKARVREARIMTFREAVIVVVMRLLPAKSMRC